MHKPVIFFFFFFIGILNEELKLGVMVILLGGSYGGVSLGYGWFSNEARQDFAFGDRSASSVSDIALLMFQMQKLYQQRLQEQHVGRFN